MEHGGRKPCILCGGRKRNLRSYGCACWKGARDCASVKDGMEDQDHVDVFQGSTKTDVCMGGKFASLMA